MRRAAGRGETRETKAWSARVYYCCFPLAFVCYRVVGCHVAAYPPVCVPPDVAGLDNKADLPCPERMTPSSVATAGLCSPS